MQTDSEKMSLEEAKQFALDHQATYQVAIMKEVVERARRGAFTEITVGKGERKKLLRSFKSLINAKYKNQGLIKKIKIIEKTS